MLENQLEALKETVVKMETLAKEAKRQIVEIESTLKESVETKAVKMPLAVTTSPQSVTSKALQYQKGGSITPKMMGFLQILMLHDFNDNAEVVAKTLGVPREQLIRMVESARNMHLLTIYGNEHIVILEGGVKVLMESGPDHVNAKCVTLQESQAFDILDFHNLKMDRAKELGVDVFNLNSLLKYMTLRLGNRVNREVVDIIVGTMPVSSMTDEDYKRWCLLKWDSYSDVPAYTSVQTTLVQHGSRGFTPVNDWTLSQMRVFCEKAKVAPKGPKNRKASWAKPIEEFLATNRAEVVPVKIEKYLPKILELLSQESMWFVDLRRSTQEYLPCMADFDYVLNLAQTEGFIEYDNSMRTCITHQGLAYLQ